MLLTVKVGQEITREAVPRPARRHAIRAQRHRLRARQIPRARRHRRGVSRDCRRRSDSRIEFFGDEIDAITRFDPLTGHAHRATQR